MKNIFLGTVFLAVTLAGGIVTTNAEEVGVSVGVGEHRDWRGDDWHHRQWRGHYAYERGCRTVITHRINDRGDRVTVRRRVCD